MSDRNVVPFPGGFDPPPGGPHDPDMERRVTQLEADFREIMGQLTAIRADLAEVKGRVTHLPGTFTMITTVIGGQVALAGILAAAFFGALRLSGLH
jgi:hypothetical protein